MGSPKALLRFHDKTFLDHIFAALERSSIEGVVIVAGRHRKEIEEAAAGKTIVFNPDYEQGMSTSIKAGIRALPPGALGAVLLLVDHPLVAAETIQKLVDNFRPDSIIVPTHVGRRGHPVLFSKDALDEILQLGPGQGANIVLRRDPGRVIEVAVDDPGVLRDIDTPEDFQALLRENSLS